MENFQNFLQACRQNNIQTVLNFLENVAGQSLAATNDNEALRQTCMQNYTFLSMRLLRIHAVQYNLTAQNNEALIYACQKGNVIVALRLLDFESVRAQANIVNNQALRFACKRVETNEIVERLLSIDVVRDNVSANNYEAFRVPLIANNLKTVQMLLELSEIEEYLATDKNETLNNLCKKGRLAMLELLLQKPKIVKKLAGNNAALSYACQYNRVDIVTCLLKFDVVMNKIDERDNEVLKWTCSNDNFNLLEKILIHPGLKIDLIAISRSLTNQQALRNLKTCLALLMLKNANLYNNFSCQINEKKLKELFYNLVKKNFYLSLAYPIRMIQKLPKELVDKIIILANEGSVHDLYFLKKCQDFNLNARVNKLTLIFDNSNNFDIVKLNEICSGNRLEICSSDSIPKEMETNVSATKCQN